MTSKTLSTCLCLAIAVFGLAQCGGDSAGPFEGEWTGSNTTTTTGTVTQSQGIGMPVTLTVNDTKMINATLVIEPGRAPGVDILAHFAGDTCYYNFVRSGATAMSMSGTMCMQSSHDNAMLMIAMPSYMQTNMDSQTSTISVTSGTLSLSGSTITLTLQATFTSNHTVMDSPDPMMMNMSQSIMANLAVSFTGTLR